MKTAKVLVTGSKGFIGNHLCTNLRNIPNIVVVSTGKNYDNDLDVTRLNEMHESVEKGVEVIIHLAAKSFVVDSFKDPYKTFYTNVVGTLNALELARLRNIKKFIFVSTYVYGQPKFLPVDEKHPANPHSPYAQSKFIAEQLCENYSSGFGIDVVTLRPFYIYGPRSKPYSFIPSVVRQILENGKVTLSGESTKRDFLFIDDFINLIKCILYEFPKGYNLYNVGYGRSYTLKQVSMFLAELLNKKIVIDFDNQMRPNDVVDMVADISKVCKSFNWKPHTSIKSGLVQYINDYAA